MAAVKKGVTIELEEGVWADVEAVVSRTGRSLEQHIAELLTLETCWVEEGEGLADVIERMRLQIVELSNAIASATMSAYQPPSRELRKSPF